LSDFGHALVVHNAKDRVEVHVDLVRRCSGCSLSVNGHAMVTAGPDRGDNVLKVAGERATFFVRRLHGVGYAESGA